MVVQARKEKRSLLLAELNPPVTKAKGDERKTGTVAKPGSSKGKPSPPAETLQPPRPPSQGGVGPELTPREKKRLQQLKEEEKAKELAELKVKEEKARKVAAYESFVKGIHFSFLPKLDNLWLNPFNSCSLRHSVASGSSWQSGVL